MNHVLFRFLKLVNFVDFLGLRSLRQEEAMLLYPGNSHTTLPHREHQAKGNCPSRNLDSKNI